MCKPRRDPRPSPETSPGCQVLLWKPALLSRYDEGQERPWYRQVKLWFGLYILLWAAVLLLVLVSFAVSR